MRFQIKKQLRTIEKGGFRMETLYIIDSFSGYDYMPPCKQT